MEMTLQQAREFVDSVPWREVKWREPGSGMHQHWYVISGWDEVPPGKFWAFVRFVRDHGYKGRYTRQDGTVTTNHYIEIGDEWVYWAIPPRQACRTRIEYQQHERLPEQQDAAGREYR